jgi:hypothetical protein
MAFRLCAVAFCYASRSNADMREPSDFTLADVPPFRIYHLLGWILASALVLLESNVQTAVLNTSRLFGRLEVVETSREAAFRYLMCLTIGGQLAIAGFGVTWRKRGLRFPSQPGHWLTILQAAVFFNLIGCQWWSIKLQRDEDPTAMDSGISRLLLLQFCLCVGIGAIGVWLAWIRREDHQWRILYFCVACSMAAAAFPAAMFFSPTIEAWFLHAVSPYGWQHYQAYATAAIPVGMFAGIATCVIFDLLENRRRDWVHWAGISLYLVSSGLTIAGRLT